MMQKTSIISNKEIMGIKPCSSDAPRYEASPQWILYQIFFAVAETKSFLSASQNMGLTLHYVSKAMSDLEADLGQSLFLFGEEEIDLSPEGMKLYQDIKASHGGDKPAIDFVPYMSYVETKDPVLNMGIMYSIDAAIISANIRDMQCCLPHLQLQIDLLRVSDIDAMGRYDCGICYGKPEDETLEVRYLYKSKHGIFASKKYLEQHKEPATVQELMEETNLIFSYRPRAGASVPKAPLWAQPFMKNPQRTSIAYNHVQKILDDVKNHHGFAILEQHYALYHDVQQVLPMVGSLGNDVYFVFRKKSNYKKNIEAIYQYLYKKTKALRP